MGHHRRSNVPRCASTQRDPQAAYRSITSLRSASSSCHSWHRLLFHRARLFGRAALSRIAARKPCEHHSHTTLDLAFQLTLIKLKKDSARPALPAKPVPDSKEDVPILADR
ncbi:hypothetical protein CBOM_07968 [Ceraceosorus bombacis]|uniref:Uncharacterized protein n=1 Tax=Ceraceosorus bombacis TaxID=401625 RepID=A0A0P1BQD2_9BASI|nr:hypothetical protein CBOM_07968 [Ceraceosorus bombacis]